MSLAVGGLTPLTTVDFPGRLAAVVFFQGCPWACGYCHNAHLRRPAEPSGPSWEEVRAFLRRRRGLLDGVVFSGGEPTLQDGLAAALAEVKELGFRTGLHTGGAYPERLRELLPLLDWVGLDVKAPFADYERVTGAAGSGEKARESLRLLVAWGGDHEARTTVHPLLHDARSLAALAADLRAEGARHWRLQESRPQGCADARFRAAAGRVEAPAGLGAGFESFAVRPA